jgi:leader peptidase (prepilin peptidase)/N-methyltransferase
MDLLTQSVFLYPLTLALGLVVGSFINVVVFRLPRILEHSWRGECAQLLGREEETPGEKPPGLARPGSRCPHCGHPIRPWENIPVLSYLLLRGKCSACGATIGLRYPIVEIASGLLALAVVWQFGPTWQGAAALLLSWALLTLGLIDYDTKLLPDLITLPLLWLGLLLSLGGLFSDPVSAIIGSATGYLALWSVYQLFRLLTGKAGMGYGDFKLLAMLGAWLGWQHLPQIIILSAVVGATVGISLIVFRGRDRNIPIPFGPYLAAAGWISLMWGDAINRIYLLWVGIV